MPLSFAEVSTASRNAMLSAKVCKTVRRAKRGAPLDTRDQRILSHGADLLSEVVQGSLLIDRKHLEERGFYANLQAYRHALSALVQLHREKKDEAHQISQDITGVFQTYRTDLASLSQGKKLSETHLERLAEFFQILSGLFFREVQAPPPIHREPF